MRFLRFVLATLLISPALITVRAQDPLEATPPAYLEALEHTDKLSLDDDAKSIVIWNRTIVTFRTTVRGRTQEQRVEQTMDRFKQLSDFDVFSEFGIEPFVYEGVEAIYFNIDGHSLFSLFETDVDPASGQTLQETADQVLVKLQELQKASQDQKKPELVLKGIVTAILATLLLLFLVILLRKTSAFLRGWLIKKPTKSAG